MKNGAAGKKNSRNSHFPKALPWFNHGSTRRGKNAGKKIESALIWGRHLQKGLVKSVGFFFPSRFLCFFFFFENQFLEKLVLKTSFFNHPNTLLQMQHSGVRLTHGVSVPAPQRRCALSTSLFFSFFSVFSLVKKVFYINQPSV